MNHDHIRETAQMAQNAILGLVERAGMVIDDPPYKVFYAKTPRFCFWDHPLAVEGLPQTHVFVREVRAKSKGDVFCQMQGEVWSPNGEARPLIEFLGLNHTSMSIGDVIQDESGVYWECIDSGWRELD